MRVSTKEIFYRLNLNEISAERKIIEKEKFDNAVYAIEKHNLKMLSKNIFNDLELVTEPMFDKVSLFKNRLMELGATKSLMSGSGPTVFGIFRSYFKALNCKNIMKKENPDSFVFIARPL